MVPDLRFLTVAPGPRADSWAYITAGCWSTVETDGHGLEFVFTAPVREERFAELLAMTAYYHADHPPRPRAQPAHRGPCCPGPTAITC
ncbi:hypothetical protein [Streptomyces sp. NPDC058294]